MKKIVAVIQAALFSQQKAEWLRMAGADVVRASLSVKSYCYVMKLKIYAV
jgi:hypothetical protein